MKPINNIKRLMKVVPFLLSFMVVGGCLFSQEDSTVAEEPAAPVRKYVKNTFEGIWIIDNQTVEVPVKKTFEMDILHRFGTIDKGYKDFFGFFAPSNIRLGFSYTPMDNLMIGTSITKKNLTWEGYAKYAILRQTKDNEFPVSVTWFSDMAVETRTKDNYINFSDRLSYFHQLIVARKFNDNLSVQLAPSLTHMNFVYGQFVDTSVEKDGKVEERSHNHFAVALSARYKIKEGMAILFNYDQPLTSWKIGDWYPFGQHKSGNPSPNIAIGFEMTTSSHAFQLFFSNFYSITPQLNNYYNNNKPGFGKWGTGDGENLFPVRGYLFGFNITRLWNY